MREVPVVRFAPSPTGPLHLGALRTALFNYLFAKGRGGRFLLRIEDTDQRRLVKGAAEYIQSSLDWLGLRPDEVISSQVAFRERYLGEAERLRSEGKAYYAFDTSEEIEEMRHRLERAGAAQLHYSALSRQEMKNELSLSVSEVQRRLDAGEQPVLRFKVPIKEEVLARDEIRGRIRVHSSTIEDKILLKADGLPTYHLAHVVDDHYSSVTHVIRGEEWLPSLPLHLLLYEALGWRVPLFAHLPLILKPKGQGKLSKRDAEEDDFPISPLEWGGTEGFKEKGFLPEALLNFLACLGWTPPEGQEVLSMDELLARFSISGVSKAGVRFEIAKLKWYNQQYIRRCSTEVLAQRLLSQHPKICVGLSERHIFESCQLMQAHVVALPELLHKSHFLRHPPVYTSPLPEDITTYLPLLEAFVKQLELRNEGISIKDQYMNLAQRQELKPRQVLPVLRYALSAEYRGPDLEQIIQLLGASEINARLRRLLDQAG